MTALLPAPRLGQHADPETIRALMRELGLVACQPRPWRPTTTLAGDASSTPDLLRRDFTCDTPATKLVGDITYSAQPRVMCSLTI